ncbi:radical SAM/SPASM domain-containing protein [Magnetospirillum sp. SS-4]|uniref:radical SAM/SPASM domain-containing protein n=1 Tax=Magnetospirillum sp. SS-4 TaxID=2681465 RepID=UPI00137F64FC|nr:radical SAM protein [Magnetospirillum sp. SS-4]CAA7617725.1 hypothetical protein MTBSS4_20019 [Magnetospirillum sp. SS-4]
MAAEKIYGERKRIERENYIRHSFPYIYSILLGRYKCTRSCRMCPMHNEVPANPEIMSDEVMTRALAPIGDRKLNLEFSAFGETFTHPRADDYMFLSRRMAPNAEIVWVTNGSVLNAERCEKIVASGIDVLQFSLDTGSPETYKWLTGSNAYDATVRNLETLLETRARRGGTHLRIQTHIIGIKELEHEFQPFLDRWTGVVDRVQVRPYGNWAGRVDPNVTPLEEETVPALRYPCAWLWYCTKIVPNGDVVKCHQHITGNDPVEHRMGNILEQDFEDIWHGDALRIAREKHLTDRAEDLPYCKDCQVWSLFWDVWERREATPDGQPARWE